MKRDQETTQNRILDILNREDQINQTDLANELGYSVRQIQRIMKDDTFVKTRRIQQKKVGNQLFYYLKSEDRQLGLSIVRLSHTERMALYLAMRTSEATFAGTPLLDDILRIRKRIREQLEEHESHCFDPDQFHQEWVFPYQILTKEISPEVFHTLTQAIYERKQICIGYNSSKQVSEQRILDPLAMVIGKWRLISWCHQRKERRDFNLFRITSAEMLNQSVMHDLDKKVLENQFGALSGKTLYNCKIRFEADMKKFFEHKKFHASQTELETYPDGSFVMAFTVSHLDDMRSWILSWGKRAHVLAPPELIELVEKELSELNTIYNLNL